MIDYARASKEISEYVRVLNEEGFKNLVIPSRGALPFVKAARAAYQLDEQRHGRRCDLINSPFLRKLILPFSADPDEKSQTSAAIREYWSRVLAAIVMRNGRDSYLSFYKLVVERLARRSWTSVLDIDLPTEKFIFVDTVISGRAICEISDAFNKVGLERCYFILIADENGGKIDTKYRKEIEKLKHVNRCTVIHVKRMFTEDRGPGASGVWSTVYPQVLEAVRNSFPWGQDCYGAGSFYHKISSVQMEPVEGVGREDYNMPITQMYSSINSIIFSALQEMYEVASPVTAAARMLALCDMWETLTGLGGYSPLNKQTTRILAEPRVRAVHPNAKVDVSSSHLVRVMLPETEIMAFIKEAKRELKGGHDVLANEFFR